MNASVGNTVFKVQMPGSSRESIAMFSEATEDPNPIHVDPDFAKECGFMQVIQQGPMTTAYFAQLLAREYGAERLKSLDLTFTAPVYPEEPLTLTSSIVALGDVIQLELKAEKADGTQTAKGSAEIRHEATQK
ncbi:MaoC family dehydratase [Eoetvoesiella caeni]